MICPYEKNYTWFLLIGYSLLLYLDVSCDLFLFECQSHLKVSALMDMTTEKVCEEKLVKSVIGMAETVQGKSSFCNLSKEVENLHAVFAKVVLILL